LFQVLGRNAGQPSQASKGHDKNLPNEVNGIQCITTARGKGTQEGKQNREDKTFQKQRVKLPCVNSRKNKLSVQNKQERESSPERFDIAMTAKKFFPFQDSIHKDVVRTSVRGPLTLALPESIGDKDFQEPPPEDELNEKCKVTQLEARANRKRRKAEKEVAVRKKEASREKPFYIMVNAYGTLMVMG